MKKYIIQRVVWLAVLLIIGLALPSSLHGQTIAISNFSQDVAGSFPLDELHWADQAFITTGADWTGPLQSIAVKYAGASSPVFFAQLYLGPPDVGTLVTNLTLGSDAAGVARFTPLSTQVLLEADSTYWLVIGLTSGTLDWGFSSNGVSAGSGTFPAEPDFSLSGYTEDGGVTWTHDAGFNQYPQYIEVTTAAVSEPAACAGLASLPVFALACWARFGRRRQSDEAVGII